MKTGWGTFPRLFVFLSMWLSVCSLHVSAQELRISDFRLPETFYQRLDLSFDGGVSRNYEKWPDFSEESRIDDAGNATLRYSLYETNESMVLNLQPSFSLSFAFSENSRVDSLRIDEIARQQGRVRLRLPLEGAWYLMPETWFAYSNVSTEAQSDFQSTNISVTRSLSEYEESESYGYDFRAEVGAGFGKVRDGQSVFAILRVLDRLREDSLLAREPTREEIILLAQLYSRRSAYLSLFDFPEKYFFGDLFAALDSLGIANEKSLTPYSILKVADVRLESIVRRLFGWKIQAGVEHHSFQRTWDGSGGRRYDRGSLDFLVLSAEYGYDVSTSTHLFASVQRRTSISKRVPKRTFTEAECLLSHEWTDRIESYLRYSLERAEEIPPYDGPRTSQLLAGQFMFYLENRVTLIFGAQYGFSVRELLFTGRAVEYTNVGASFILTYRFF